MREEVELFAKMLNEAKPDTLFAIETFLAAVERGHPAKLVLDVDRKGSIEGQVQAGPRVQPE